MERGAHSLTLSCRIFSNALQNHLVTSANRVESSHAGWSRWARKHSLLPVRRWRFMKDIVIGGLRFHLTGVLLGSRLIVDADDVALPLSRSRSWIVRSITVVFFFPCYSSPCSPPSSSSSSLSFFHQRFAQINEDGNRYDDKTNRNLSTDNDGTLMVLLKH